MKKYNLLFLFFISIIFISNAQVNLKNASFEDEPQDATIPTGWHACELGSTPDILPGFWGVVNEPYDGDTYMGLITRDDGSFESVGQRLSGTLKKEECYRFDLQLAHSDTYASYNMPLKLKIWACTARCSKGQLIGNTDLIIHKDWKKYSFEFYANSEFNYILFEAYFADGFYGSYRGNILIDDCSAIKTCTRADLLDNEKVYLEGEVYRF